jgi:hypothetical protein
MIVAMAIEEERVRRIEVRERVTIQRPAWEVREHFRDLTHHASSDLHPHLRVQVEERRADRCRYLLTAQAGPLRLRHEVLLWGEDDGVLVNELRTGVLRGARLTFSFDWLGPHETEVTAVVDAPLRGATRLLRSVVRRHLASALRRMLEQDREDLESTRYERTRRRIVHPSLT